jgi:hypothetical protein
VYGRRVNRLGVGIMTALYSGALLGACGGAPEPRAAAASSVPSPARAATQRAPEPDVCAAQPGSPPPEPLARSYSGVAAKARCQAEVHAIMRGVSDSLGVECTYCHLVPDYSAMTHRKQIANWMASELVPALQKKSTGKAPWCSDCHQSTGNGAAKFLGAPRNTSLAIEWMTTHLVEDFATKSGSALRCKGCHRGNLGTPQFQRKIMLTDLPPSD